MIRIVIDTTKATKDEVAALDAKMKHVESLAREFSVWMQTPAAVKPRQLVVQLPEDYAPADGIKNQD